jgi:hypothetical protein
MHTRLRRGLLWLSILIAVITFALPAAAQQSASRLIITGSDASSAPTIELYAYGVDSQGSALDLAAQPLIVLHDGQPVANVEVAGQVDGGTFTLFVIDVPPGVSDQAPAIQQAIQQFAAPPNMVERVDYVGVYQVDAAAASPLLEPTHFFNAVANLFANPLAIQDGPTALIDSLGGLINNIQALQPDPNLVPAIVVMSDGTDAVSTQFQAGDVPTLAAELGVPIHTILLTNTNLNETLAAEGQQYMTQLAQGTGGVATTLDSAEGVTSIWNRIASFRPRTIVRYTAENLVGGEHPVTLRLQNNPNIQDETTVTVPAGAPTVVINLPAESRTLTLQNLDAPVPLSFSTDVSWLDGVERTITAAQLLVNGVVVQEIDPTSLDRFDTEVSNFVFGENRVQVYVEDDQGGRATSPQILLTVNQGEQTELPEEIQPVGVTGQLGQRLRAALPYIGGCFAVLFLLVLFAVIAYFSRRSPLLQRLGLMGLVRRIPFLRPYVQDVYEVQQVARQAQYYKGQASRYAPEVRGQRDVKGPVAKSIAFLEVVEATSDITGRIELKAVEQRLGRSPQQSDIAFENDITVSRVHASIVQEGNDYRVYDEQSTSGTYVNEQRVPEYGLQLADGDEIRMGAVRLRFRQP